MQLSTSPLYLVIYHLLLKYQIFSQTWHVLDWNLYHPIKNCSPKVFLDLVNKNSTIPISQAIILKVILDSSLCLTLYIYFIGIYYPLSISSSVNTWFQDTILSVCLSLSPRVVNILLIDLPVHFSPSITPSPIHSKSYSSQNCLSGLRHLTPYLWDCMHYHPTGFTLSYS